MFLGDSDCYHNARHGNSTKVLYEICFYRGVNWFLGDFIDGLKALC